eukprot:GSMAST32.ASY1.ANO1.1019.1 assembled CDS
MAWRCSGVSNGELIKNLVGASIIHTDRVIQTMLVTDRQIGFNATISAPHMHGYALEWLMLDHINQLVELARSNISSYNRDFLDSGKVTLQQTDAAAPSIPVALVDQLKCGGLYEKLEEFDPDINGHQEILAVSKDKDGHVSTKSLMGVRFIPLTSVETQIKG